MLGNRLSEHLAFEELKLIAGVVLLSPFIPLLFMGEEYGERAPFQYFISHTDPALIEAVCRGRREEFAAFEWKSEVADPQDEATFLRSKLRQELRNQGWHRKLGEFYEELIRLRKAAPSLRSMSKEDMEVLGYEQEKILFIRRWAGKEEVDIIFNFDCRPKSVALPIPAGEWRKQLDSEEETWGGRGSDVPLRIQSRGEMSIPINRKAFVVFVRAEEA